MHELACAMNCTFVHELPAALKKEPRPSGEVAPQGDGEGKPSSYELIKTATYNRSPLVLFFLLFLLFSSI